jgi:hypothetical protein
VPSGAAHGPTPPPLDPPDPRPSSRSTAR